MKRLSMLLISATALMLVLAGCKKEQPQEEPTATESAATEELTEEEQEEVEAEKAKEAARQAAAEEDQEKDQEEGATAATGARASEEHCGALYDTMQELVAEMEKRFGKGKSTKKGEMPPREKFVEACQELPPEVVRCMNPRIAMQEQAKCAEVMQKTDKARVERFQQILGANKKK